jgi:hypothetical protein
MSIAERVQEAAAKKLLFLPHAVRQMSRPERMIESWEVREAIEHGEVIDAWLGTRTPTDSRRMRSERRISGNHHSVYSK